jgi:peptidoglycan/LPS O-acetylase OafA/YrhL
MSDAATPHQLGVDPRFQNRERQPGLDLLRALAIIVVVVYHAALFGFKLPGRVDRFGWIGVDLFFVLSGYLIGGQLLAPLAHGQDIKLGRFFTRRALRIMPAYFAVLAIYFLLPSWREYSEMSQPLWKFLLSVQNIALHGGTAFSHAWSLAVEDQFYLALPFLLLFLFRRPRAAIVIPCLIILGGLLLRTFLAWKIRRLTAACRSVLFKRGSIIRPGPGSIRLSSELFWLRSRNFDRTGGNASSIAHPGCGCPRSG